MTADLFIVGALVVAVLGVAWLGWRMSGVYWSHPEIDRLSEPIDPIAAMQEAWCRTFHFHRVISTPERMFLRCDQCHRETPGITFQPPAVDLPTAAFLDELRGWLIARRDPRIRRTPNGWVIDHLSEAAGDYCREMAHQCSRS